MAVREVIDLSTEKFMRELTDINPKYEDTAIIKAYEIALRLHEGQFRKSGEPYIIHPIAVAKILAGFGMDNETVIAGLLHDVVEDTAYTREELVNDFDEKIAALVDGGTKLGNISYDASSEKIQAENNLTSALAGLRVSLEAYPDLKANQNFLQLQTEIADIENKLAAVRRFFNSATRELNNAVQTFPSNIFAGMFGFHKEPMFEVSKEERADLDKAPEIKF